MSITVCFKGAGLHTLQQHHRQHMRLLVESCVDAATYVSTYNFCMDLQNHSTWFRCVWTC